MAFAVAMGLVYGPHETIVPGNQEWNKAENVLYGTFQHPLWGLVVAWVTYACHCGYGSKLMLSGWGGRVGGGPARQYAPDPLYTGPCMEYKVNYIYNLSISNHLRITNAIHGNYNSFFHPRLHSGVSVSKILDSSQSFNVLCVFDSHRRDEFHVSCHKRNNVLRDDYHRKFEALSSALFIAFSNVPFFVRPKTN